MILKKLLLFIQMMAQPMVILFDSSREMAGTSFPAI